MTDLDLSEQALLECDTTNGCTDGAYIEQYQSLFSGKMHGLFFHERQQEYQGNQMDDDDCPINDDYFYNPGAIVEKIYNVYDCNDELLKQMVFFSV